MNFSKSPICGVIMTFAFMSTTSATATDSNNVVDCSIFEKEGYEQYSARIEEGLSIIEDVEAIIRTKKAEEIRQYIEVNIDEQMEQHAGRTDQEYWFKSTVRDLCRWESQRLFEDILMQRGAEPPNEVDRAILKEAFPAYPHSKMKNNLEPLNALSRVRAKLECTGTYADALSIRSREFRDAYNRSKCPLKFR